MSEIVFLAAGALVGCGLVCILYLLTLRTRPSRGCRGCGLRRPDSSSVAVRTRWVRRRVPAGCVRRPRYPSVAGPTAHRLRRRSSWKTVRAFRGRWNPSEACSVLGICGGALRWGSSWPGYWRGAAWAGPGLKVVGALKTVVDTRRSQAGVRIRRQAQGLPPS